MGLRGMPPRHQANEDIGPRFRVPEVRGLVRQRVQDALQIAVEHHPLTLVIAPAGSGKTTALAQFAAASSRRHVWYRATSHLAAPEQLVAQLALALRQVVAPPDHTDDVDDWAAALGRVSPAPPTVLLIDDLHELTGSAGEATLERLVRTLPDWLRVLAATRHRPGFNHPALQLTEDLTEITGDVLRWRPWEVERLFRDYYRMRLRPEEAARLTQRTEGWAAGLQLFHLASQHLPLARRTRLIDDLHTRPGLVRDYLTHNVLVSLPAAVRTFLVDTCVLGRLDHDLCDRLRDRNDSAALLTELERRRLFLVPRDDGLGHRYHEVLRAHLEVLLLERDGTVASRTRFHRAARLLEADGAPAEALRAYTRAEAWQDVARLLGSDGPALAQGGQVVLAGLPRSLVATDPWLRLAQARALVADGHLTAATEAYREAQEAFATLPGARICRDERTALQPWVDPREHPPGRLTDHLRAAARRDPRRSAMLALDQPTAEAVLVAATAMLLAGAVDEARRLAGDAGGRPDADIFTIAAARALEHLAGLLGGQPGDPGDLSWSAETFEQLGATWLARLVRAIADCRTPDGLDEVAAMWDLLDPVQDRWGPPLLRLAAGIASVLHDRPEPAWLDDAATDLRRLGAGTLEAWARAWEALARASRHEPEPVAAAEQARSLARHAQVPGAEAIAELAIAWSGDPAADDAHDRAVALARDLGMALPTLPAAAAPSEPEPTPVAVPPPVVVGVVEAAPAVSRVTCFGGLTLTLDGGEIDLSGLKPQSRAVLAFMAMQADTPVHRDRLLDVLWRDEDPVSALRRLPVLISTVRRHLEPLAAPGVWSRLVRQGEAYVLRTPPGTWVDVRVVEDAALTARRARARGDEVGEMEAHRVVLAAYQGELLPEFGAVEWLVEEREHHRAQYAGSAQALAAWHLAGGDAPASVEAARAGLRVDRYRSRLWSLLADAHRASGDRVAAAHAEQEHAAILDELGLPTTEVAAHRVVVSGGSGTRAR